MQLSRTHELEGGNNVKALLIRFSKIKLAKMKIWAKKKRCFRWLKRGLGNLMKWEGGERKTLRCGPGALHRLDTCPPRLM